MLLVLSRIRQISSGYLRHRLRRNPGAHVSVTFTTGSLESMAELLLSEAERTFILHGVQDGIRIDGRSCEDFRYMEVETDLISHTNGSARLRLENTEILAAVKAEIGSPDPSRPTQGRIEFSVDCTANATPEFEGRGGDELASEIGSMLRRTYDNCQALDLSSLCIIPGQQCWVLYVDILILECGGNLYDASSFAVKAAIFNTKLTNVSVSEGEKGEREIVVSDDPYDCRRLNVKHVPIIITLNKIGHSYVVDASMQEEACSLARLMMGVTEDGQVTAVNKAGSGSLHPETVLEMLQTGKKVGSVLNKNLRQKLEEEEKLGIKRTHFGFLR